MRELSIASYAGAKLLPAVPSGEAGREQEKGEESMKIYVASSWRNPWQPGVVKLLRKKGHDVYDFREPTPGERGFAWSDIDPDWKEWRPKAYRMALDHPIARHGFARDIEALQVCDACIMVLPCGNSANLELGIAIGEGKLTAALFPYGIPIEPIGGHSVDSSRACGPCGDLEGCWLPGKLANIEPELMTKAAGSILLDADELIKWQDNAGKVRK